MTRLIDADAMKLSHCKECTLYPDNCLGDDCDWESIAHIDMMPTVDAVPVEYILKQIVKLERSKGQSYHAICYRHLIEEWQMENERKEE